LLLSHSNYVRTVIYCTFCSVNYYFRPNPNPSPNTNPNPNPSPNPSPFVR